MKVLRSKEVKQLFQSHAMNLSENYLSLAAHEITYVVSGIIILHRLVGFLFIYRPLYIPVSFGTFERWESSPLCGGGRKDRSDSELRDTLLKCDQPLVCQCYCLVATRTFWKQFATVLQLDKFSSFICLNQ